MTDALPPDLERAGPEERLIGMTTMVERIEDSIANGTDLARLTLALASRIAERPIYSRREAIVTIVDAFNIRIAADYANIVYTACS